MHLLFNRMCWLRLQQLPAGVDFSSFLQECMAAAHNYLGVGWLCKHIKAVVAGNLSSLSSSISCCSCFVLGLVAPVSMPPLPPEMSLVGDSLHKLIIQGMLAGYLHYMAQSQLQLQSVTACVALDSQVQPVMMSQNKQACTIKGGVLKRMLTSQACMICSCTDGVDTVLHHPATLRHFILRAAAGCMQSKSCCSGNKLA